MDVGEVLVRLSGDVTGLTAAINTAVKKLDELGNKSTETQKKISTSAVTMGAAIGTFAGQVLVQAAVKSYQYALSLQDVASRMVDLSGRTGIAVSTLYKLDPILKSSGASVEAFANSALRASTEIGQIQKVTDPAYKAIKELSINFDALAAASPAEQMRVLFEALGNVTDEARQNALAVQFFGLSYKQIKPAVDELKGAIGSVDPELDKAAQKLNEYQKKSTEMWAAISRVATIRTAEFITAVQGMIDKAKPLLQGFIDWLANHYPGRTRGDASEFGVTPQMQAQQKALEQFQPFDLEYKAPPATPPHRILEDPEAAARVKAAALAIQSFTDSLQRQITSEKVATELIENGSRASRQMAIDAELAAFKTDLWTRSQTRLTAGQEAKFKALGQQYLDAADAADLAKTKVEAFKIVEEANADAVEKQKKKWQDLDDVLNELATSGLTSLNNPMYQVDKAIQDINAHIDEMKTKAAEMGRIDLFPQIEDLRRQRIDELFPMISGADLPIDEARDRAEKLGQQVGDSITQGIRNTLMGVETGQQTLAEGMKNVVMNMALELQFLVFDETILKPIKAFAEGFVTGLFQSISDEFDKQMKSWGLQMGNLLRQFLGMLGGSNYSFMGPDFAAQAAFNPLGAGGVQAVGAPATARGGLILPQYARGGGIPIMAHSGEFVMSAPAVNRIGQRTLAAMNEGKSSDGTQVIINGDITPRQPNMSPDQVIKIVTRNIHEDGVIQGAIQNRTRRQ